MDFLQDFDLDLEAVIQEIELPDFDNFASVIFSQVPAKAKGEDGDYFQLTQLDFNESTSPPVQDQDLFQQVRLTGEIAVQPCVQPHIETIETVETVENDQLSSASTLGELFPVDFQLTQLDFSESTSPPVQDQDLFQQVRLTGEIAVQPCVQPHIETIETVETASTLGELFDMMGSEQHRWSAPTAEEESKENVEPDVHRPTKLSSRNRRIIKKPKVATSNKNGQPATRPYRSWRNTVTLLDAAKRTFECTRPPPRQYPHVSSKH